MLSDLAQCEKKAKGRRELSFPFAPLVLSEQVPHFLLGLRVRAWPCLVACPLGQPGRPERDARTWVTSSSQRGE